MSESPLRIKLDLNRTEDYGLFLKIRSLPSYRFVGREAIIPREYADRLGIGTDGASLARTYNASPFLFDYQRGVSELAIRKRKFAIFMRCGLGKCVVEGTLIPTDRGLVPIESLCTERGTDRAVPINVTVQSIDGPTQATVFYSSGLNPTVQITTRTGFQLAGTLGHPVLCLSKSGSIEWRKLSEIRAGDYVAIQRHGQVWGSDAELPAPCYFQSAKYTPEDRAIAVEMVRVHGKVGVACLDAIQAATGKRPSPQSVLGWCGRTKAKITQLERLNIPETLDADTAYVFGLIVGDGCMRLSDSFSLSNTDESIIQAFEGWMNRVGLRVKKKNEIDHVVFSTVLKNWLNNVGIHNVLAHEKSSPPICLRTNRENTRAYLQGLFDTDGSSLKSGGIEFCTSSAKLAKEVHLLLLQFGIIARMRFKANRSKGAWMLQMHGPEARKFYDLIGFRLARKQARSALLPKTCNTNIDVIPHLPNVDRVRGDNSIRNYLRGRHRPSYEKLRGLVELYPAFASLVEREYFWDEVVDVRDGGIKRTFDLTVPGSHSFVANGIVSHNTLCISEYAKHVLDVLPDRKAVLIVAPLMVVEQSIDEIRRFYGESLPIEQIRAADLPRWAAEGKGRLGITNYEALTDKVPQGRIGALIPDESSIMKSQYGEYGQQLIRLGRGLEWKLALTGTPAPNDRIEYANHAVFLDAFPTVNAFLARFFINRGQTDNRWEIKPHALKPFYRALSHWCIFMSSPATYGYKDNAAPLPPIHTHIHNIELTESQSQAARDLTGMLMPLNPGGITTRSKLSQIAKGRSNGKDIDSLKPEFIKGLVGSWPEESTIIWCRFNPEQDGIARMFPGAANISGATKYEARRPLINDFKAGTRKVLISKPEVLGFGLNLQKCTQMIFSSLDDSYEKYHQAIARANRVGSQFPLGVHIPVTELEIPLVENVLRKADRIDQDTKVQEEMFRDVACR